MPPKSTNNPRRPAPPSTTSRRAAITIDSASTTPTSTPTPTITDHTNPPIDPKLITAPRSRNVGPTATTTTSCSPPRVGVGVQRLQSLKKRTPAGSLIPLNPDGTTPKPTLRYQPRAVERKSKQEREALEKLEAERQRERMKEAAALRRADVIAAGRGRERGGMVRGRGRGRGMFVGGDVSGPLGSGMSMRSRGGGYGGAAGKGKHGYGHGHGGRSSAGKGHGLVKAKSEDGVDVVGGEGGGDISSDEGSDEGPRFSIEQINIISDEEEGVEEEFGDGEGKGKMPARNSVGGGAGRGLRPVRVERQEHQARSVGINTDASSQKSAELRRQAKAKAKEKQGGDESLFVQDSEEDADGGSETEGDDTVEVTAEKAVGGTIYGGMRIKQEPTDDGDVSMVDALPQAIEESAVTTDAGAVPPAAPKTQTRKKRITIQDTRSKLQTEEERQEWDRHEQDIEHLKQALGTITTHDSTAEGEQAPEQQAEPKEFEAPKDERAGRLFLIQFPPATPNLIVPSQVVDGMDQDVVETGSQVTTQLPSVPAIKKEATEDLPAPQPTFTSNINRNGVLSPLITATNSSLPPGRVGKLNIHQSGRATIDWGGISFELTKGSDVEFLQDAIVASGEKPSATGADEGLPKEELEEKRVWAMSQVSGKFVVTPDWEALLGV
ncbi:hypothetical protein AJ78_06368 [Emergomyces pasteurianus Ep9510]|uniref:DNA-directed RNA polymerase III RPC4 n=1 Tax=Emergomyces pasteurianus Ep9510 TaxID=1447872 RepID=A0A1J9P961_9EURO|nr:hypothetical protein AJ78_06368 [Emergomyces pasteurianus Ep9510]